MKSPRQPALSRRDTGDDRGRPRTVHRSRSTFLILAFLLLLGGCATSAMDAATPRLQLFVLENTGTAALQEVEINYGAFVVPDRGSSRRTVPPGKLAMFQETATVPVPANARIHWIGAGGNAHDLVVPVAKMIDDWKTFEGFRFSFSGDHLTVFRADRTGESTTFLPLRWVPVFESSDQ